MNESVFPPQVISWLALIGMGWIVVTLGTLAEWISERLRGAAHARARARANRILAERQTAKDVAEWVDVARPEAPEWGTVLVQGDWTDVTPHVTDRQSVAVAEQMIQRPGRAPAEKEEEE